MASNYEVNIKLNTRTINKQLGNLEKRISKINKLAQGGRASRTVLQNEKHKINLATKRLQIENRNLRTKQRQLQVDRQQLKVEQQTAAAINKQTKVPRGPRVSRGVSGSPMGPSSPLNFTNQGTLLPGRGFTGGGNKGVLSGALISGAFPLLLEQGPLGAAAGFTGGLIGGKLGGQTGGFAGGLVATALLTQVQQITDSTAKLGQAFNILTPDVEGLTKALGANGTEREKQIQLIKKTEGTQAALAAVTAQMNQQIGEKGVKNLKEFGELSRLVGNQFQLLGTKMLAALVPVLNLLATPFAGPAERAETQRLAEIGGASTDPTLLALQEQLANVSSSGQGRSGAKRAADRRIELEGLIQARKEELALVGKTLERQTTVNMIEDSRLKKIRQSNALLQAKIDGNHEEVLLAQELDAKIKEMLEDGMTEQEIDRKKIEDLLIQNNLLEKQAQQAEKIKQQFASLGQSLATDVADGLQGLIRGTSTLNDMLNNVLNKLIDAAFNMALFGNPGGTLGGGGLFGSLFSGLGSIFGGGGGPAPFVAAPGTFGTNIPSGADLLPGSFGITGTLANGGSAKGGKSYLVGERGPEIFTPGVSGMVTPNHALGGSTNVVVNVDASGSNVEGDEEEGRQLGFALSAAIESELIKQKRPGGLLA